MQQYLTIETVEEILKGKISTNPNRFEEANGIVFSVYEGTENMYDYFNSRGIEYYELASGIYYTETVMSAVEFDQLDRVMYTKHIA